MSDPNDRLHLTEMIEACWDIESDSGGLSQESWIEVGTLVRSVSMSLIALGEGAAQLSPTLKAKAPGIPWNRMIGLRNRLAHAYFRADRRIIWEAARLHTPGIKAQLIGLLEGLESLD